MANRDDIFGSLGTPDWTAASGSTDAFTDGSTIDDSSSVIFAFRDVDVPSSPQGILIEAGATGDGMALSFDGTTGDLVGAAGLGSTTAPDGNTAFATLPKSVVAGKTVDIYWCIRPSAVGRVKIYAFDHATGDFLGLAYGETTDGSTLGTQDAEGDWTGSNTAAVGFGSTVRSGVDISSFNGTLNLGAEAWNATLPSDFDGDGWTHDTAASLTASGSVSASAFRWNDSFVGYGAGPYGALSYGTARINTVIAPSTTLAAAGALFAAVEKYKVTTAALTATGSLAADTVKLAVISPVTLSASGSLSATAVRSGIGASLLGSYGIVAATPVRIGTAAVSLTGEGSLASTGNAVFRRSAALLANGSITAAPVATRYRSAALLGSGGQLTAGRLVWTPITADTATWATTTPSLPTWSDVTAGTETWTELQAAA